MAELYYEDLETGAIVRSDTLCVTREAIIAFATQYDPQPFHLDEAAGAASLLGGLAASGWHTLGLSMRLLYDGFVRDAASMGSPGFDEVRWLRPVRPGDVLSLVITIGEKRLSASRPDRGLVVIRIETVNAAGETVMTQRGPVMVQKRGATQAVQHPAVLPAGPAAAAEPDADDNLTRFFADVQIGRETVLGSQTFSPQIIVDYARLYDPQYFHLDAEAAKQSHFGGLIASGWQTAAFWMKHYIEARRRSGELRAAAGLPVATGGPSPGFSNMKWLRPVHAGQTVTYALKTVAKRKVPMPGWGMILTENTGRTPDGTLVFRFDGRMLWPTTQG